VKKFESCFIITPIGDPGSEINREAMGVISAAIIPALGAFGMTADNIISAADINQSGVIETQIVERIIKSDLVIANLTTNNANVLYELAIRHAMGTPIILIIRDDIKPCFDISNQRHIKYKNDAQGVIDLRGTLVKFLNDLDKFEPQNVIYDVLKSTQEKTIFQREGELKVPADKLQILFDKIDKLEDIQTRNFYRQRYFQVDSDKLEARENENIRPIVYTVKIVDLPLLRKYVIESISKLQSSGSITCFSSKDTSPISLLKDAINIVFDSDPRIKCDVSWPGDIKNIYMVIISPSKIPVTIFEKGLNIIPGIKVI